MMETRPFAVRVPEDLMVAVQEDTGIAGDDTVSGMTGGTKQTAGSITPDSETKLTWVPGGTGFPWRSAIDKVTDVETPSTV